MGTTGIREIKQTDGRRYKKINGGFTGVKTFEVWLSDNSDEILETVLDAEDPITGLKIPLFGESWSSTKQGLKVVDSEASDSDDGYLQLITVNYSTEDIEEKEDDPTQDVWEWSYDTTVIQKVLYEDPIQKVDPGDIPADPAANPPRPKIDANKYLPKITNSASVQTPLMVDDGDRLIQLKRNIDPAGFDPDDKFDFEFSCNQLPVNLDGKQYAARRVAIKKIKISRKKTRNDIGFLTQIITFSVARPRYDQSVDLLNQGTKQLIDGNDKPVDIKIAKTGKVATKPIALDKAGLSIQDTGAGYEFSYFRFFKYPEADWSSLNLM
jgi:hypothetical protein